VVNCTKIGPQNRVRRARRATRGRRRTGEELVVLGVALAWRVGLRLA